MQARRGDALGGRWSRLIHRCGRAFWQAFARAPAFGGDLSLTWLPRTVLPDDATVVLARPATHRDGRFNDDPSVRPAGSLLA